jgi:hypothetical protein
MAARNRLYHPEEVRAKIKTSLLINRLMQHVKGKKMMEKSQVTAALGLLKKTLPDLSSIDATHKGDPEHPLVISSTDGAL